MGFMSDSVTGSLALRGSMLLIVMGIGIYWVKGWHNRVAVQNVNIPGVGLQDDEGNERDRADPGEYLMCPNGKQLHLYYTCGRVKHTPRLKVRRLLVCEKCQQWDLEAGEED